MRTGIEIFWLALVAIGCDVSVSSSTSSAPSSTAPAAAAGDSVGAAECDDVLKRAAAQDCKDKPGVATISGNRENWKRGLSEANTREATIQGCKAAAQTLDVVCVAGGAPPTSGAPASGSSAAGTTAAESVGAPECDEVLTKADSCKDKPGVAAIVANRANWKNGLANSMTKEGTLQGCRAAMETLKTLGCGSGGDAAAGGAGAWDGKTAYKCSGDDVATITGVTANIPAGPAITASGNCKVTFKDCKITTDKGISPSGSAAVTLDGGELTVTDTAIDATGASKVDVKGTKVAGKVTSSGAATVAGVPLNK